MNAVVWRRQLALELSDRAPKGRAAGAKPLLPGGRQLQAVGTRVVRIRIAHDFSAADQPANGVAKRRTADAARARELGRRDGLELLDAREEPVQVGVDLIRAQLALDERRRVARGGNDVVEEGAAPGRPATRHAPIIGRG